MSFRPSKGIRRCVYRISPKWSPAQVQHWPSPPHPESGGGRRRAYAGRAGLLRLRTTQVAGRAGTQGAGQLEDTDGDTRFVGWTSGEDRFDPYPHGTLWHNGSVIRDNGALEGVIAVNRAGDTLDIDGNGHAVTPNGGVSIRLKWPVDAQWYRGIRNISDDGLIIGEVQYTDNTRHALLWSVSTAGTTVRDLGVIGSSHKGELRDIDHTGGQIVGTAETGNLKKAITGTPSTSLSPLGGVDSRVESTATDIAGDPSSAPVPWRVLRPRAPCCGRTVFHGRYLLPARPLTSTPMASWSGGSPPGALSGPTPCAALPGQRCRRWPDSPTPAPTRSRPMAESSGTRGRPHRCGQQPADGPGGLDLPVIG